MANVFKEMKFKDKFSFVVIKPSPRKSGYVASTYLKNGVYVGCKHIKVDELEDFIRYQLDDYERV